MENKFKEEYGMPDPGCLYKWAWSTILLGPGTTNSCHRVGMEDVPLDFGNFHNTPGKLEDRKKMLNGEWPGRGCEYCRDIEAAGGISDRMDLNNKSPERFIPIEMKNKKKEIPTNVTPTIVEVYFSNLCNLGCVYCESKFSSVIENEARKYNLISENVNAKRVGTDEGYARRLEQFWAWLKINAKNISRYNILGGEPFYQPELEQNIDFFEEYPCPDLDLVIFSNLKVNKTKFTKILDKTKSLIERKHIKSLKLLASIDGIGKDEEYVRSGLNMDAWKDNFELLCRNYPTILIECHLTMSCLNVKAMPKLFEFIADMNKLHRNKIHDDNHDYLVWWSLNFVTRPDYMSPNIFPTGFFDKDFDKMCSFIKVDIDIEMMRGYQKTVNAGEYNPELIEKLKEALTVLDQRRNTDWKTAFPWLVEFKNEVIE